MTSERHVDDLFDLTGKVVLITGAGGYLGSAMCRALVEAGATVVASSRRAERAQQVAAELEETGGEINPIGGDTVRMPPEEEKELLSEIIEVLNDSFGRELTDGDKVKFETIQNRIRENEEFQRVYTGDNTETNKKHVFERVFDDVVLGLVEEDVDFYNKINHSETNRYLKDKFYQSYSDPG